MNSRSGTYITCYRLGESYQAYVPPKLPPSPPLDLSRLYPYLEKAVFALAKLNSVHKLDPHASLLTYMYVHKEALLSSQIEGSRSNFLDLLLFENHLKSEVSLEEVEEVSYYVKALEYGLRCLKEDFPLSLNLLKEIHGVLLSGARGSYKLPGEFRRSQNWIGGTRLRGALFVPPPITHLADCLTDFENFLHDDSTPLLIKAGLVHVQFETLHPFLDGNGRLGRLLITLLLCEGGILDAPILYLSLYLKQNRSTYYALLQEVRLYGSWETWLEFFLEGIHLSAKQAIKTIEQINALFTQDFQKIETLGRIRFSCQKILKYMKRLPQVSVSVIAKALHMTPPTARSALNHLTALGILEEVTGKARDKVYVYRNYLTILEEGTEPFSKEEA
ncbi:MAG: Fic/DOC family N-terminal domain-containing protein [Candidatus Rhabdochlamydia sp.]